VSERLWETTLRQYAEVWGRTHRFALTNRIFGVEESVTDAEAQQTEQESDNSLNINQIAPLIEGPLLTRAQQISLARDGILGMPTDMEWQQADGIRMRISDMATRHIVNTILMLMRTQRRVWNHGSYCRLMTEINRRNDARRQGINIEPQTD